MVGKVLNITWAIKGFTDVAIDYSSNGGQKWQSVETDYSGAQPYKWTVVNPPTAEALIKLTPIGVTDLAPAESPLFTVIPGGIGGVAETTQSGIEGMHIYPNPANAGGEMRLSFMNQKAETMQMDVFDVLGRAVYHSLTFEAHAGLVNLPLGRFATSGSYIVRITDGKGFVASQSFSVH